jgi:homoserine O-acetyltransferase
MSPQSGATGKSKGRKVTDDPPDSPRSVGWTEPQLQRIVTAEEHIVLEKGGRVGPVDIEYETYGSLSPTKDNVVLICHALSGDAHVAGWDRLADSTGRAYRLKHPGG